MVISSRAHLDLEYHLALDGLKESYLKDKKIGTTKKGIGPCYTDKISRDGLRMCDFIKDDFDKKYEEHLIEKNKEIVKYGGEAIDLKESLNKYKEVERWEIKTLFLVKVKSPMKFMLMGWIHNF